MLSFCGATVHYTEELGGALFNVGILDINDAIFDRNAAGSDGLAIYNFEALQGLSNLTFNENMFNCPPGEYSRAQDVSTTVNLLQ